MEVVVVVGGTWKGEVEGVRGKLVHWQAQRPWRTLVQGWGQWRGRWWKGEGGGWRGEGGGVQ